MARRAIIEMLDDFDDSPASETIEYVFDGVKYSIDLSEENAAEFRAMMEPWNEAAWQKKPIKRQYTRKSGNPAMAKFAIADPEVRRKVRKWANENGFAPLPPGYLRPEVQKAYKAAHGGKLA